MTLLIAVLLLNAGGYGWPMYLIAVMAWALHLFYYDKG